MNDREQLEKAIEHLEGQRPLLGDAVVDASIAALREKIRSLEAQVQPESQRKQITVLFADVSGFTALAEKMDAEDVSNLINALWGRLDRTITDHGGMIDKHMGDGVMALWGVERAREDDPERAVRAALAMQATLRSTNEEIGWGKTGSHDGRDSAIVPMDVPGLLRVRIGVNTGPVLLGSVGSRGEFTAMGDTVNLASRLEQTAPVGGILISHDTYRHVRGRFEVQTIEPVRVKGKAEPVQVYVVQRARPRGFYTGARGIEGIETRMIGREAELAHLQEAFAALVGKGEKRLVTVLGEAGVGKSRLIHEFLAWLDTQGKMCLFKGRANEEIQSVPYSLLRDLFARRLQIQESDSLPAVRQKIEMEIGSGPDGGGQMRAHFIGQLLGYELGDSPFLREVVGDGVRSPDPRQLRDRALLYMSDYFAEAGADQPVVIVLEDLHWADDSSLDAVEYLASAACQVLVVAAARPTLMERRPGWGQEPGLFAPGQSQRTSLNIQPLSRGDSLSLLNEILQKVELVPAALQEMVVGSAEGNPFYVEELVKMLIEDGAIVRGEERWRVETGRLAGLHLPPTLTAVLQARFDGLPPLERQTLQRASVIGRTFWDMAVAFLGRRPVQGEVGADTSVALDALNAREMIFHVQPSTFAGTDEYTFKHNLLRQATYESVLKRDRQIFHARAAEWLQQICGDRANEFTGLLAEHLALSGQMLEAAWYLQQAGEQAARRFANLEAVRYFTRALDLLAPDAAASRYAVLKNRERAYDFLGQRSAQLEDLAAMESLALSLEKPEQIETGLRRANYANVTGDHAAAAEAARKAIDLLHQDPELVNRAGASMVQAYLEWGRALWKQSNYDAALLQLQQARAMAVTLGLVQLEADCLRGLGNVTWYRGDYLQARQCYEDALAIYRKTGNAWGEGQALNDIGNVLWIRNEPEEARKFYELAYHIHQEIGNRRSQGIVLTNLGNICLRQGEASDARRFFEQSLRICGEIGERSGIGRAFNNLGGLAVQQGNYPEARANFERALPVFRETLDRLAEGVTLGNLCQVCVKLNDLGAALTYGRQAEKLAQEICDPNLYLEALSNLSKVLVMMGEYADAQKLDEEVTRQRQIIETIGPLANAPAFGMLSTRPGAPPPDQALKPLEPFSRRKRRRPLA